MSELLSAELSAGDELESEATTSNEYAGSLSFPSAADDESRMVSFVWSQAEPTLYRAAAVSGEPVGDAILEISSETVGRSRHGTKGLENVNRAESMSLRCESVPIIDGGRPNSEKPSQDKGAEPAVAPNTPSWLIEPREAAF
ncbi:hypothetical protein FPOAC1_009107 [Fusarium poae]|jgi:hypothetical protein|uniref:hypothetical protein n=1 Tax=Fusarium poae TaxID=36050 RepID=UPI001CE79F2A|nr:hypothetical protein FPOAC1_009107 [Fusarium poae]KAG8669708.1 hypothetical protein FPOAC1_009107 [Fusarium poae]